MQANNLPASEREDNQGAEPHAPAVGGNEATTTSGRIVELKGAPVANTGAIPQAQPVDKHDFAIGAVLRKVFSAQKAREYVSLTAQGKWARKAARLRGALEEIGYKIEARK